jgi:hypothetical protein
MAVKTFTTGEVLTASDTNTYLNNGGLVYIAQATATSGSTLAVDNCFTSTYDNYRIVISNVYGSTSSVDLYFRLRVSGTNAITAYYWGFSGLYSNAASANDSGANVAYYKAGYLGSNSQPLLNSTIEVMQPQIAQPTMLTSIYSYYVGGVGFAGRSGGGGHDAATAYDGFALVLGSGTFTSCRVRVYGYRQA